MAEFQSFNYFITAKYLQVQIFPHPTHLLDCGSHGIYYLLSYFWVNVLWQVIKSIMKTEQITSRYKTDLVWKSPWQLPPKWRSNLRKGWRLSEQSCLAAAEGQLAEGVAGSARTWPRTLPTRCVLSFSCSISLFNKAYPKQNKVVSSSSRH